jgi:putative sugar O-methyltransferase
VNKNDTIDLTKWFLKRFGFLKKVIFESIDRLIYQKNSQFLLHPWNAHRCPFKVILFYNFFGRVLFGIREFLALISHGIIFQKNISLDGYNQKSNKNSNYEMLYPPSPLKKIQKNTVPTQFYKKMSLSLSLAYKIEEDNFDKTQEWDRIAHLFKKLYIDKEGNIIQSELINFRNDPQIYQKLFNDQFTYIDNSDGYYKSYLKSIDLVLEYHRYAKKIKKEILASISESYAGENCCPSYRGNRLSEKILFHSLIVNDIVENINFNKEERNIIFDIGSGYGGLERVLYNYIPNSCFILLDLPETLILSSYFIKYNFPDKKIALLDDIVDRLDQFEKLINEYDFIIIPPSVTKNIPDKSIDLVINSASLAFMADEYLEYYLKHINRTLKQDSYFYSLNSEKNSKWGIGFYEWDFQGDYLTVMMNYNNRFSYAQWLGKKI